MTVSELIEKLKTFDPSLPVLLNGYEGGLSEVASVTKLKVSFDQNSEDYYGPHEENEGSEKSAVCIKRGWR